MVTTADCPHPDFEPADKSPLYAPPMFRCTSCGLLWSVTSDPVQAWMAAQGPEPS